MPSAAVDAAFQSRLAQNWSVGPVLEDNGGVVTPPTGVNVFLVVQYPVVNGTKPVLGRTYWEEGAARLVLSVKSGIGLSAGLGWADTLASLFRNRKFGGVETFAPSSPITNNASDDGNWFELAVIVPYRYEFTDA
jgi:hypothetical protein